MMNDVVYGYNRKLTAARITFKKDGTQTTWEGNETVYWSEIRIAWQLANCTSLNGTFAVDLGHTLITLKIQKQLGR